MAIPKTIPQSLSRVPPDLAEFRTSLEISSEKSAGASGLTLDRFDALLAGIDTAIAQIQDSISGCRIVATRKGSKTYYEYRSYDSTQRRTVYRGSAKNLDAENNAKLERHRKLVAARRELVRWRDSYANLFS